jgi:hypothetical protein
LEQIGRYLLGVADLFRLLIDRLDEFGRALIEFAAKIASDKIAGQS